MQSNLGLLHALAVLSLRWRSWKAPASTGVP
jgi:hypothetical protein